MVILGVTGQTGAGKTTLLEAVSCLDGTVIDCDALYWELLASDKTMKTKICDLFPNILDGNQEIDRKKLGVEVFSDGLKLQQLNEITHPIIIENVDRIIEEAKNKGCKVVAIDAIALIESGLGKKCDEVIGVVAPKEVRISRILKRDSISEEYAQKRVEAQKDEDFFRENADVVVENYFLEKELFLEFALDFVKSILNNKGDMKMMEEKKETRGDQLRKTLLYKPKHGFEEFNLEEMEALEAYCTGYKQFLDIGKTERECVERTIAMAEEAGFKPYVRGMALMPGDKIYSNNRGKAITLAVIGRKSLSEGIKIAAAHIDAPRIDLKPIPLYEENEMAWLKTHYYGGIRKYQWVAIPLELRGVVVMNDGQTVKVSVGSGENDPQFTITDLLPHLAADQSKKPLSEAITGEGLNILVGSLPLRGEEGADLVKLSILDLLNTKYGITEADFTSAELSAVPAFNARDIGFDRSMIGAYGQDDRVCSYAALASLLQVENPPEHTAVCMLADKEEIGSEGVTGMKSRAFDAFIGDICDYFKVNINECFEHSLCVSADVTAAFDPNHADAYDKRNSAFLNRGVGLCKYTGARGKSGASDASAEVVGEVRRIFDKNNITWQICELGKVDKGGGGTVAAYMAERNIDTLDAGVAVLSMHSPFETVAKLDCYMMFKGMKHIYES